MSDYNDWRERADRGTSGDMVHDILSDWNKERELLRETLQKIADMGQDVSGGAVTKWEGIARDALAKIE